MTRASSEGRAPAEASAQEVRDYAESVRAEVEALLQRQVAALQLPHDALQRRELPLEVVRGRRGLLFPLGHLFFEAVGIQRSAFSQARLSFIRLKAER